MTMIKRTSNFASGLFGFIFAIALVAGLSPELVNAAQTVTQMGLSAGSAIIGKVGIDQTTDGTTNLVAAKQSGTWNVGTVSTVTNVVHVDDNSGSLTIDGTVAVSGTVAISEAAGATTPAKAEDVASANADVGIPAMAVEQSTPANTGGTNGDWGFLQMSGGALWTQGKGTAGSAAGGVMTVQGAASMTPVQVGDNSGSLTVDNGGTFAVQAAGTVAHDAVGSSVSPLLVGGYASAAAPTSVSADGDAVDAWFLRNGAQATTLTAAGALIGGDASNGLDVDVTRLSALVAGTAVIGKVGIDQTTDGTTNLVAAKQSGTWTVQPGNTANTTAWLFTVGTGATDLGKAEDAAHSSGDVGVQMLTVRKNTAAATSGTDGDYQPPISNTRGAMWIAIEDGSGGQVTSFSGGTQYTEDAAAASDPVGPMMMGVRRDTLSAAEVSADGDNVAIKATSKGQAHVKALDTDTILGEVQASPTSNTVLDRLKTLNTSILAGNITLGQAVMASSAPMTIASDQTWAYAAGLGKAEDVASANADVGVPAMVVQKATPANTGGTDGDYENLQTSGGYLWVHDNKGLSNRAFAVAFATNTRPANTTAYAAADSISNNATAGSVTALVSGNISDVNDDPFFLSEIRVVSTDTGLAGKRIRAYVFNSDPTASSGVGGGDNAAFSQKVAGYQGSFSGVCETGFSDGTVCRLTPAYNDLTATTAPAQNAPAGSFIQVKPVSGAKTLYVEYQTLDIFTPSANSTTLIGTAIGWQARAN